MSALDPQTLIALAILSGHSTGEAEMKQAIASIYAATAKCGEFAQKMLDDSSEGNRNYVSTLMSLTPEKSSKRMILHLEQNPLDEDADDTAIAANKDSIRTFRHDDPYGRKQIQSLRSLIGHRVMVCKRQEKMTRKVGGGDSFKVAYHLEDLGADNRATIITNDEGRAIRAQWSEN